MDIKIEGRGIWHTLHLLALHATTSKLKEAYITMVTLLADNFGCESCKDDFKNYVSQIRKYYHIEQGMFKWSVDFHNFVNVKLNKPVVEYNDALLKFKNLVCTNCNQEETKEVKIIVPLSSSTTKPKLSIKSFH